MIFRGGLLTDEYLSEITTKVLTDAQQRSLDDKISANEYSEALKSFQTYKRPGNDGLTVEFYLGFWHLVEKCLCARKGTIYPTRRNRL